MKPFLARHSLIIGLVLMFLYTWTIELSKSGVLPFEVPFPIYLTLGWGFIFVSLLMTWLTLGRDEAATLFKRFFLWRVGWKWFLAALLIEPFCIVAGVYLNAALTRTPPDFSAAMAFQIFGESANLLIFILPFFLVDLITNGEEMGWRGYVLPRLQAKHSALTASLILGVIWAFWHLPKYVTHFNIAAFGWAVLHFLAFAVILTWLYNNTKGSLLVVAVCHAVSNTVGVFMPVANTAANGDMGAYSFYVLVEVLAAVIVTVAAGSANLSRTEEKQIQGVPMKSKNRPTILHKGYALALLTALLFSFAAPAAAGTGGIASGRNTPVSPNQAQGPTDAAEMEGFLDDLFARQMEANHIAGAAVAVVKDGKLFFSKGYGYANVENKIPVDAERTLFHVGSVGKTFTWTAVMQLAAQGKLDLDTDVNTYLDFRIPDTYPQPITLKHLMTHTSGIEDRWLGSAVADESELAPVREWLAANFPGRVRPPGEAAGYSNYNAMLAGYIVARVSGQPYEQYIQEHLFDPLGMTHSTVYSPMPPDLRQDLSVSYTYADGAFQPFPDYLVQPAGMPSGMHHASVTDMARFMIAHLQGGFYGDASAEIRILEESTAQKMLTTLYTPDPRLRGAAYGFFDFSDNGQWTLGHSGYLPSMHSLLLLLPDQNLGVYIAYNSAGGGGLTIQHAGFQRAFFDHYYPAPVVEPIQPPADFAARANRFVGFYRSANSHSTNPEKIIGLLGGFTIEITAPGDGALLIPMEGLELRFVEVEPLYFRQADGSFSLLFREDDRGNITHMFTDIQPQNGFVRLNWYETSGFHMTLALVCVLLFLSMLPVGLIRALRNRHSDGNRDPASCGARTAGRLIFAISLLNVLFLTGLALWFRPERPSELHGLPLTVEIVLGLGVLSAVLTVGALVYTVLAWKNRYWGAALRVYYTLATLAAVAFVWFLHYWNWLGWRY